MIYLSWTLYAAAYLAVAICILLGAKKLFDWLTPYSLEVQLTTKDNPAVGLVLTGFVLGVTAVICGAFSGESAVEVSFAQFVSEIGPVLLYGLVGMVLLFFAGVINDKVVLHKFCNHDEIVEKRNMGVASMMAATYIGSGIIAGSAIAGSISSLEAIICFLAGQIALVLFAFFYQRITSYDDLKEIGEHKNTAAGVAFGGNLLAYSIILMKGVSMSDGAIESTADLVGHFLYYAVIGCLLLVITRVITDRIFIPSEKLSKEIAEDRNLSAGFVEAGLAIAAGTLLTFCL